MQDKVDVSVSNTTGSTALDVARTDQRAEVARLLEELIRLQALEHESRLRQELMHESLRHSANSPSTTDMPLEQDRRLLHHAMITASSSPVELSSSYIQNCVTIKT